MQFVHIAPRYTFQEKVTSIALAAQAHRGTNHILFGTGTKETTNDLRCSRMDYRAGAGVPGPAHNGGEMSELEIKMYSLLLSAVRDPENKGVYLHCWQAMFLAREADEWYDRILWGSPHLT